MKPHRGQEQVLPSRPHPKSKDQCGTQEDIGCNKQGSEEKTTNNLERNLILKEKKYLEKELNECFKANNS